MSWCISAIAAQRSENLMSLKISEVVDNERVETNFDGKAFDLKAQSMLGNLIVNASVLEGTLLLWLTKFLRFTP